MDYWKETISEAFEDAGITATDEQIDTVASWAESAHDNYSMAHGHDVASANFYAAERREKDELEQRLEYEQTVSRKRCNTCSGHGSYRDGWGREFGCTDCDGKGSTPEWPFEYRPSRAYQREAR